ncbi:pilus assembly PilX N-terminal domain-containing protein [Patescibacteria group bacterium]|nr:pilus assembly PilX N-terminal domain-containing protein [Patescibacteria group bacterium]MBU4482173.1 pilus assembly PilX N-terminal domain-containing protein [Patescibacteria group bacterium]
MNSHKGTILMLTLVMTSVFTIASLSLASLAIAQNRLANQKTSWHNALNIAEAGLNYYRWHLAHAPEDYENDIGIHDYNDPQSGVVGQYNLEITAPSECSSVVTIKSTGWTNKFPNTKRVAQTKYGLASLSSFAFITNSDVWFGNEEILHGPVHSNGGIRQDGTNDSLMTSAKETYTCQPYHGCDPAQTKDGVWGVGGDKELWNFPTSNIDFDMLTVDLNTLKDLAETSGIYLPQRGLGYRINFKADGTIDVYRVTKLKNNVEYSGMDGDWHRGSWDIDREEFDANYALPSECAIIFVQDNVWVDGVVNGRATLVAAKLPEVSNNNRSIIINNNLTYLEKNGQHVLGLIAQQDILVPLYAAPEDLEINAVLLAQNGSVYRPYYDTPWPYYIRDTITTYGTIISNQTWTWTWVNDLGSCVSGYCNTNTIYDSHLNYNPPPGFPTYGDYKFLQWEETTEK